MNDANFDDFYAVPTGDGGFAVGGVKLARPFRISRLGHFGFNSDDVETAVKFYTQLLGFDITDILDAGHRLTDE
ncbi:MAG: VOC family protein [Alphaproteobacteria bacterium]|jgi:hypothetical protein